jgi:dihydroxyacetone kinase DhaKLM complex PTS-EIIA-like component DhaM
MSKKLSLTVISLVVVIASVAVSFTVAKYQKLRKMYNEVAIAFLTGTTKPQSQAEAKAIRDAVEHSTPLVSNQEVVDLGVVKDSSGSWKVRPK